MQAATHAHHRWPAQQPVTVLAPPRRKVLPGLSRLRSVMRRSRRHGAWILLWSGVGLIGTLLAPVLTGHPFLLMLLSPRALFVAMASDSVGLVPFVLLGTLRLSATDASYFIIGRTVPDELAGHTTPRKGGPLRRAIRTIAIRGDRICRWFCARPRLAGAFLFVRPNGKYLGFAGAYGVNRWLAGLSATLGTATFLTAMHIGIGAAF